MRAEIINRIIRESATNGRSSENKRCCRLCWSLLICLCLCWSSFSSAQEPSTSSDDEVAIEEEDPSSDDEVPIEEADTSPDDDIQIDLQMVEEGIAPKRDPALEEIIVTAQGGKRVLQEISVSVAAFDAEYLEALGAESIADIAQFTPNLEIRSVFAASNPTLFIRGVGLRDFNANSSSSVAVYNDDVYMNSPAGQLAQLFDVQQIEVLRGPQGTLYGRNASAGAIRVIARKPTGDPGGYTRLSYGNFNALEVEGATEISILPELVSLRVAGKMAQRDGTTINRCADDKYWGDYKQGESPASFQSAVFTRCFNVDTVTPIEEGGLGWVAGPLPADGVPRQGSFYPDASGAEEPSDIHRRVNDVGNWAARALLQVDPTPDMGWTINVHGGQNRSQARQFQTIGAKVDAATNELDTPREDGNNYTDPDNVLGFMLLPPPNPFGRMTAILAALPEDGNPYQGDYNRTGNEDLDLFGTSLTGEISFGDLQIRTITAYEWNDRFVEANVDGNPFIGLELDLGNTAWQVSQEIRGYWDGGGAMTAQGGVYFLHEDLIVDNKFRTSRTTASFQDYSQKTYAGSLYGYLTWEASESFTIEGGARWNIDHKTFDLTTGPGNGIPGSEANPARLVSDSTRVTKHAPTGDISINYRPVDDLNIYLKYSRGWKGPHINGGALGIQNQSSGASLITPVDPEKVNALELGFKAMLFDNRVRLNAAGFYYDYDDIQIFQLKNAEGGVPVQELINANDADVYGVEIELETRPLEGWAPEELEGLLVFMSFAWLDTQYTDFLNTKVNFVGGNPVPVTENLSGNTLINAPPYAFTGYAQWDFPIAGWGTLAPRFDWAFKDKVYFSPQNLSEVSQDALWLLNARLTYTTPNDMVEIAGWVRNLTDEVYHADVINLSNFQQALLYIMGDPRTYGFSLTVRF
jgi:iron complex outermembrane receptor protein